MYGITVTGFGGALLFMTESIVDYSQNRHIMRVMMRKVKNGLCIVLACLLGIAPLSRVFAETHSSLPLQHSQELSATMQHGDHDSYQNAAPEECENCVSVHPCNSHNHPCSQCASCITSFLPLLLEIHFESVSNYIGLVEPGLKSHLPSPLYRPPRS